MTDAQSDGLGCFIVIGLMICSASLSLAGAYFLTVAVQAVMP